MIKLNESENLTTLHVPFKTCGRGFPANQNLDFNTLFPRGFDAKYD